MIPGAGPRTAFNYNPMADTYVQIYGAGSLQYSGELSLATFTIGSTSYAGHGRYAFWNSSEDKLIILEQADSTASLLSDYGVAVCSMTTPATGCAFTPGATSATLSSDQGSSTISVTTGAGCIWEAVSNASWITLGSGGASFGPAVVTYSVSANTGSTTRSGTLTIAGQTFTVTQTAPSSTTVATAFAVSAPESATVGTPCRLVDTRAGAPSTVSSGALIGGSNRTLPLLSSNCNVPPAATAYSLNFTVVPAAGLLGYLTVYPTGVARPVVSTLNSLTGTIVANAAIIPAGAAGGIDVFATDTTDLIVDINGYFGPPGAGGLSFYSLPPCRVLDTRNPPGSPPFTGQINVNVIGSGCGGTEQAQAYVFNATVVPSASLGYLTLWAQGAGEPLVSTENSLDGAITSNMAIVPTSPSGVSALATDKTHLILDMSGYFAP